MSEAIVVAEEPEAVPDLPAPDVGRGEVAWAEVGKPGGEGGEVQKRAQHVTIPKLIAKRAGEAVTRYPLTIFWSCCVVIWTLSAIVVFTGAFAFSETAVKDWDVLDSRLTEYVDAIDVASQQADCVEAPDPCPAVEERSTSDVGQVGMIMMYQSKDGPVLTPSKLQTICKVERLFIGSPAYPDVCTLKAGRAALVRGAGEKFNISDCQPQQLSIASMAYQMAGMDISECGVLPEAVVQGLSDRLHMGLANASTFQSSGFYLGGDVIADGAWDGRRSALTRSLLSLGYPFVGFAPGAIATPEVALEIADKFYNQFEEDFLVYFNREHSLLRSAYWGTFETEGVDVLVFGSAFFGIETRRVINTDMAFCAFSIIFVWAYLVYHTGSFFAGTISLWQIVMTIPMCVFFYRFIFGVTYYQQLHGLLIFIILGIGADDVFVYSDAWRQSVDVIDSLEKERSEAERAQEPWDEDRIMMERVSFSYRHTLITVMNTSFTTSVAFLSTASSPIMPIKSMGVYAFTLVLANYFAVITLTPAVFVISERYLPSCRCCCRRKVSKVSAETLTLARKSMFGFLGLRQYRSGRFFRGSQIFRETPSNSRKSAILEMQEAHAPAIIGRVVLPILRFPCAAPVFIVVLVAWAIVNLAYASKLQPPVDAFTFFAPEHMRERSLVLNSKGYAAGATTAYNTLTISFGVRGIDRDREPGVDVWKPHIWYGVPQYDEEFDISKPESQQFLRDFCKAFREEDCAAVGCEPVGKLLQPSAGSVSCFIEEFDVWTGGQRYEGPEFIKKLKEFRKVAQPQTPIELSTWAKSIGLVNGEIKYVTILGKMTLRTNRGVTVKEDTLAVLEAFIARQQSKAPPGMKHILHSVPFDWAWLVTSLGLVEGLFVGFAICFPVAFLVLLIATRNIFMAFIAILNVIFIVAGVLGYCSMAGWALGAGECVAGIIVIGLSVDYVIHLGHMYLEASHLGLQTREERFSFALNTMGSTVIAGAATTFFAALVMQFCQVVFFNQMSTLMVLTVVYSIVYSLFCFMAMLYVFGPQGNFGDIGWLCRGLHLSSK